MSTFTRDCKFTVSSNLPVIEARLRSRSGCGPSHQAGPLPRLLRHLAEVDSVGLGRADLALGRQQLVLALHGGGDDVEEDEGRAHGLPEDVLGPGGEAETSAEVRPTETN